MNRHLYVLTAITSLAFLLQSCYKTETWETIEIPEMLQSSITRLEVFDNGVLACVSDGGIFVQYSENNWKIYSRNDIYNFNEIDWRQSRLFCDPQQNIWIVGEYHVVQVTGSEVNVTISPTAPPYPVAGYAMSPEGTLYRADYWLDGVNDNLNWVYYIRLSAWDEEEQAWIISNTDMEVPDLHYDDPAMAFDEQGVLHICSNPVFKITQFSSSSVEYEVITPDDAGFTLKSIHHPQFMGNDIYGFDRDATDDHPLTRALSLDLSTGLPVQTLVTDECIYSDEAVGPVRVMTQKEGHTFSFIKIFTNSYSENRELLGYVADFDHTFPACNLTEFKATEALPFSEGINDIDLSADGKSLLIGTNTGLLIHNLQTGEAATYLEDVLQLDIQ